MARFCEYGNELAGKMKGMEYQEQLTEYQLLKM
jgi:hypothetical protein